MNRKIFICLLFSPLIGISQQPFDFIVKGKVASLNTPAMVFLRYTENQKQVTDSAVLHDGNFEFNGRITNPLKASITLLREGRTNTRSRATDGITIYLEKGVIKLNSTDSIKNANVEGSSINRENTVLLAALKPLSDRNKAIMDDFSKLPKDQQKDEAVNAEIGKQLREISNTQTKIVGDFIKSHPKSWVSLENLKSYGGYYPEYSEVNPMFNNLSSELKQSPDGVAYSQRLEKIQHTAIGAQAPEFEQNDVNGKSVSLASFKGKYVLVDFWASWCGPCRAENPNVVKTYHNYKDKNFTILGVSLDQPGARDLWLKAIDDDHLEWTQVSDLQYWNNSVAKLYGINAIPQNFLIDPSGKIVGKNLRAEGLKTKLGELIK